MLPFDVSRFTFQDFQYTPSYPPVSGSLPGVFPQIMGKVGEVSAYLANTILRERNNSPVRMFLANQMARQNFNNPEFHWLVTFACNYLFMEMNINRGADPIQTVVSNTCRFAAARDILTYQELLQMLPPQAYNDAVMTNNMFDQINNAIKQAMMGGQQAPVQQFQQPMYQAPQGNFGMQNGFNQPMQNNGFVNPQQSFFTPQPMQQFNQMNSQVQPTSMGTNDMYSHYADKFNQPPQQNAQQFQPEVPMVVETIVEEPEVTEGIVTNGYTWAPSRLQPFFPAFNPYKQYVQYIEQTCSGETVIVAQRKAGGYVDRAQHMTSIQNVKFNMRARNGSDPEVELKKWLREQETGLDEDGNPVVIDENAKYDMDVSEQSVERTLQYNIRKRFSVYVKDGVIVRNAIVSKPILSVEDRTEVIEDLQQAVTFDDVQKTLKESMEESEIKEDEDGVGFTDSIDEHLTGEVNSFLNNEMGVEGKITSFMDDVDKLPTVLEENYGQIYKDIYIRLQSELIKKFLRFATDETNVENVRNMIDSEHDDHPNSEESDVKIYPINMEMKFVALNFDSGTLGLYGCEDHPAKIDGVSHVTLYKIMTKIFEKGDNFSHVYFYTNDRKKFHVCKSAFDKNTFVIKLIQ